ncbi:hypothetical protein KFL_005650040 [Klebsormidium nitens]|uniref:Uncharacterized protein n=1 Tax=Klebsormidium nitens TaxID=105231 RepID=A0A1Y1IIC4_KLENI|nr:hypothetical protein KFL_005650040 [Klebsormidium nitens]|eukprot:GAQ89812.1 hypothetical protein KFL_005650040 [Klebsormidium nitens]
MPPKRKGEGSKKGGKKGKKQSKPTFYTGEEHCLPFGFRAGDLIRTPLGLIGTILGVKFARPDDKETGVMWVEYEGGKQVPLERGVVGYERLTEAEHIWRDVVVIRTRVQKEEEERAAIEQAQRLRMEALALEAAASKKKRKSTASRPQTGQKLKGTKVINLLSGHRVVCSI